MGLDAHIQNYLRGAASRGREVERIGPFLATFSPGDDNPYLNYAIPDDGARPSSEDVSALVAAYRRHNRTPRLEYLPGLAPDVEAALLEGGLVVEGRPPLMVYEPGTEREVPVPAGIELVVPTTDEDLWGMLVAQNEAYGGSAPTVEQVESQRAFLAAGGLGILAREAGTGEPAGAGGCTVPANGTTELVGVGVRDKFRRRGIAAAMTAHLVRDALSVGVTTVFLMAAHEAEARIYARAGFSQVGEVLHISLPGRLNHATGGMGE
ncbi:MAG TPA: GNAT family N-acetyltransferase [Chloroflexia bacterium]|nr:GNAT family N-acetyltransferase [Chloroflexia bacterium]